MKTKGAFQLAWRYVAPASRAVVAAGPGLGAGFGLTYGGAGGGAGSRRGYEMRARAAATPLIMRVHRAVPPICCSRRCVPGVMLGHHAREPVRCDS